VLSFVHQVLSVPGDGAWDRDQAGCAGDVGLEAEVLLELPEVVDVVVDVMGGGGGADFVCVGRVVCREVESYRCFFLEFVERGGDECGVIWSGDIICLAVGELFLELVEVVSRWVITVVHTV
jgi:hypothetical protein